MLRINVLGPISATIDGHRVDIRGAHQRRLLSMLAAAEGEVVSTDRLVDRLWAGEPPDAAIKTFRTYVARLRRSFEAAGAADGATLVVTDAPGYRIGDDVSIDAMSFAATVDRARDRLEAGEPAAAWTHLDEALGLWSGSAFDEFASEEWAIAAAVRLDELRLVARELRVEAQLEGGRHAESIAEIEALVAEHPLRERPRRALMVALYRSGRQAEALRAGRAFGEFLAEQTGLEPSSTITDVEAMIIAEDPRLDATDRGQRLRGYVLGEPIGADDHGTVHRARQPSIERDVAITVIPAELADDASFVRRFESRANAVAEVEHPGVAPIYDYWREPGGAYLVTRYYSAGTLAARQLSGSLTVAEVDQLVRQVLDALWATHQRGVVHGNVTPHAIWFDDRGAAVLGLFEMVDSGMSHHRDLVDFADVVDALAAAIEVESVDAGPTRGRARLMRLAERLRAPSDGSTSVALDVLLDLDAEADGRADAGGDATASTGSSRRSMTGPNPFRGLAAFSEADAAVFFGRSAIVDEVADVVRRHKVAALIGPSGSGKSSVVRAGLVPRYRAAGAYVTTMLPGTHPLQELELAVTRIAPAPVAGLGSRLADEQDSDALTTELRSIVAHPDDPILLVVDQFEELFTLSTPLERDRFLDAVLHAVEHPAVDLRVAATCRADFVGLVLDHPAAGPLFRAGSVLVTPLSNDELADSIVGPAEHAGVAVEPALVAEVVGDAVGSPGSLPMVQYVLTEVFAAAADAGVMTLADARRLGGVNGVLAQRAEEVFAELSPDDQAGARRLFTRLVTLGDSTAATRRRVLRTDLAGVGDDVIDTFGNARLLSFDRDPATRAPTIEVSHEALLRHWPRLAGWITEESDGLRVLVHLTAAAADWHDGGRDASLLYRGARLDAAESWARDHPDRLTAIESDFVSHSVAARDADAERERSRLARLRLLTVGLASFLVIALVAAVLAFTAGRRADDRAAEAEAARLESDEARSEAESARSESDTVRRSAEVSALAGNARLLAESDPIASMLLAVEASARGSADDPAVAAALLDSLSGDPRATQLRGPTPSTGGLVLPLGGFYPFVSGGSDGATVDVYDSSSGETRIVQLDVLPSAAAVDPTGAYVYTVAADQLELRDVASGEMLAGQPVQNFRITAPGPPGTATGGDNGDLASVYPGGRLVVHTLPDLAAVASIDVAPDTFALARSGDGSLAVLLDDSGNLTIAPIDGSAPPATFPRPPRTDQVALDATGARLALSGLSGPTYVIDLASGDLEPLIIEAATRIPLAFSPSGASLAVSTGDGVEIYDTTTGELVAPRIDFATGVTVRFTGERTLEAFASSLGVVAVDLDATSRVVNLVEVPDWGVAGFVAPDASGAIVIVPSEDGVSDWWFPEPLAGTGSGPLEIGPNTNTRQSRAVVGGRYITADLVAARYDVFDSDGAVGTVDLAGAAPPGYEFAISPRAGVAADILVLEGPDFDGRIVVVDRAAGVAAVRATGPGLTIAEFADQTESEVIVGDLDGRVRWFDADGSAASAEVTVGAAIGSLAVTPDGLLTAIGDWSGTVTVVDRDRTVVAELDGDAPFPIRMAFVADGHRLVVQSEDGSSVLWDVESGTRIGTLLRTDGVRGALEMLPGGDEILVPTGDGIARITVSPDRWKDLACASVDRPLSESELTSVVPGLESLGDPCRG